MTGHTLLIPYLTLITSHTDPILEVSNLNSGGQLWLQRRKCLRPSWTSTKNISVKTQNSQHCSPSPSAPSRTPSLSPCSLWRGKEVRHWPLGLIQTASQPCGQKCNYSVLRTQGRDSVTKHDTRCHDPNRTTTLQLPNPSPQELKLSLMLA